ncbi:protein transport protein SEC31-like isoform X2 [Dermochelys coriacea]|uniref:protein transport protein SEC31-like isoform X2 n=1 Tax=Dermochelys coriacea TaxID=27794 RepID=UPI001CA7CD41|nr:protein transport protein SEC31-like isoform X2 [Dermochelys coriacea]
MTRPGRPAPPPRPLCPASPRQHRQPPPWLGALSPRRLARGKWAACAKQRRRAREPGSFLSERSTQARQGGGRGGLAKGRWSVGAGLRPGGGNLSAAPQAAGAGAALLWHEGPPCDPCPPLAVQQLCSSGSPARNPPSPGAAGRREPRGAAPAGLESPGVSRPIDSLPRSPAAGWALPEHGHGAALPSAGPLFFSAPPEPLAPDVSLSLCGRRCWPSQRRQPSCFHPSQFSFCRCALEDEAIHTGEAPLSEKKANQEE